jgi:hypothetical protein
MIDLVLKGKITFKGSEDKFLEDFGKFLDSHQATFDGTYRVYQFDDCEIISDEETGN